MHVAVSKRIESIYICSVIILQVVRASRLAIYRRTAVETNGFFRESEAYKQRTGSARTRKHNALLFICAILRLYILFCVCQCVANCLMKIKYSSLDYL